MSTPSATTLADPTCRVIWATHPRHLPDPPEGKVVVVDVAFAAGKQYKKKTRPFIDALGNRLVRWIDHHNHPQGWAEVEGDRRFILVPNQIAHACPELITPKVVDDAIEDVGRPDAIVAHCDFDGLLSAVKWRLGGAEPWEGADEDACAIDSPGRGHKLTAIGERWALALDEGSARYDRDERLALMHRVCDAITLQAAHDEAPNAALTEEVERLGQAAKTAQQEAEATCQSNGKEEHPGVFVIRVNAKQDNRQRRNLLMAAEERAPIGALLEPDPQGGAWVYAATFDPDVNLEKVDGFEGGRTDFRFARANKGGDAQIQALGAYIAQLRG